MKTSKMLSFFLFGLLFAGIVQAQDAAPKMLTSTEPMMMDIMDAEPMEKMMRGEEMKMEGEHSDCMFAKEGKKCGGEHSECPMKKMMKGHHGAMGVFGKLLCGAGMLLFLFLGTFVIRKGWKLGGCCVKKACKK